MVMANRPRHHVLTINRLGEDALHQVVTVREAAELWGYHPRTSQLAINLGRINARKSGCIWLVSTASLLQHYGSPPTLRTFA